MGIVVVRRIISCPKQEESRWSGTTIRQQSRRRYGEPLRHHRGLRAGHDFKGVTRELERALLFPQVRNEDPEDKGYRTTKSPWRLRGASSPKGEPSEGRCPRKGTRTTEEVGEVSRNERQSEVTREGHGAVLAAHSTDGSLSREGGEPRPKGPTVGKARPGITSTWKRKIGDT